MWIPAACGSAVFAGLMAISARLGLQKANAALANALRTIVVLIFAWIVVMITHQMPAIKSIDGRSWLFLILSGTATGASWFCYFKAIQSGPVAQAAAIDKSSGVLTLLLAFLLLHESFSWLKGIGMVLIAGGTWMMIDPTPDFSHLEKGSWIVYAIGAAVFASLSSILAKIGVQDVPSHLATMIRTAVVLVFSWIMVFVRHAEHDFNTIHKKELFWIVVSGCMTGGSWICYYYALQVGPASGVAAVDKMSIALTVLFSVFILHEKMSKRAWIGLALLCAGTLCMVF